MMTNEFKFTIGDRVATVRQVFDENGRVGTVTGRYSGYDNIEREHDTVLATSPWSELMYTVNFDDGDSKAQIHGESSLMLLADYEAALARE